MDRFLFLLWCILISISIGMFIGEYIVIKDCNAKKEYSSIYTRDVISCDVL